MSGFVDIFHKHRELQVLASIPCNVLNRSNEVKDVAARQHSPLAVTTLISVVVAIYSNGVRVVVAISGLTRREMVAWHHFYDANLCCCCE